MSQYAINKQSFSNTALTGTVVDVDPVSARSVGQFILCNSNTTAVYFQLFYLKAASVTLGTTTPNLAIMVPAATTLSIPIPGGWWTHGALSIAVTTTATGSTAPTLTSVVNFLYA